MAKLFLRPFPLKSPPDVRSGTARNLANALFAAIPELRLVELREEAESGRVTLRTAPGLAPDDPRMQAAIDEWTPCYVAVDYHGRVPPPHYIPTIVEIIICAAFVAVIVATLLGRCR